MAQQIDIVANLLMKVDGAEAGINKLKSSLSKLKMPEGLENSFKKSFANLDVIFARYKSQVEKGFNTKADVSNLAKTGKALDAELNRISKHFTELTGKQVDFKINSAEITKTEQELTKLITQRNELAKSSVKFEITGAKEGYKDIESLLTKLKEVAGNTKTGQYAAGALDFLKQGDLQSALVLLDKASVSCKRLNQDKQNLFSATGLDMSTAIKKIVEELTGAEGKFGNVNAEVTKFEQILADLRTGQIKDAGELAKKLADDMLNAGTAAKQADGAMQDFAQSSFNMTQQLGQLQQSTQYFFSLRNMLNLLKRGVDQAIDTVKELDAAMTQTAVVTDFSVGDMWEKLPQYTANANALGASVKDMYEATTLYYQQGLDTDAAMGIANETMKMARIGGLEAADATDKMTAALRGFNMELNETSAQRVNDVYSNLAAKTASDTEELGTAMQRTASIAASAGMSFEGTAAFLAQAIETTREPAENLGTAMKTIVARFTELKKNPLEIAEVDGEEVSYNKVDTALQSIGVSLKDTNGQFRDLDQVFLDISQRWNSLSQTQQRYIATIAAGSRQQSRFIAMMSNYDRTVQLMDYANNSAGASNEQFGKTMESLEAKLNKLQNAWNEFLMGIANSSFIKTAVDGLTDVIDKVNKLIDTLSLGNGGLQSLLSIFAAFKGLKYAGRGINGLIGGVAGSLSSNGSFTEGFKTGFIGKGKTEITQATNQITQAIYSLVPHIDGKTNADPNQYRFQDPGRYNNARKELVESLGGHIGQIKKGQGTYTAGGILDIINANQLNKQQQKQFFQSSPGLKKNLMKSLNNLYKEVGTDKKTIQSLTSGFKTGDLGLEEALMNNPKLTTSFKNAYSKLMDKGDLEAAYLLKNKYRGKLYSEAQAQGLKGNDIQDYINKNLDEQVVLNEKGQQFLQNPQVLTNSEKFANLAGQIGAGFMSAGSAVQMFGAQISQINPAIGQAISNFGGLLTTVGSFANVIPSIIAGGPVAWGITAAVAAIGAVTVGFKAHSENIKKQGQEIIDTYSEVSDELQTSISNIKGYQAELARLSTGVDKNGFNINLDDSDYLRYQELVDDLVQQNPAIVEGWNSEGKAIINVNKALKETIKLKQQELDAAQEEYLSDTSGQKLIRARNEEKGYKLADSKLGSDGTAIVSDIINKGLEDEAKSAGFDLERIKQGDVQALNFLRDHYTLLENIYKQGGQEISETLSNQMSELDENLTAYDEAIAPLVDYLKEYANTEKLFADLPVELTDAFNKGIESIAGKDLNINEMKGLTNLLSQELRGAFEKAKPLLDEADTALNKFGQDLDEASYNKSAENIADQLRDMADGAIALGHTEVAQWYENQASRITNAITNATESIAENVNTLADDIANAKTNFEALGESIDDYYSLADQAHGLVETALSEKNIEGKGSKTFWNTYRGLASEDAYNKHDRDKAIADMEQFQKYFTEGAEGSRAFAQKIINSQDDIIKGEGDLAGKRVSDFFKMAEDGTMQVTDAFTNLTDEQYAQLASVFDLSADGFTAVLNKLRQFGDLDFTDPKGVRKAMALDERSIKTNTTVKETEEGKVNRLYYGQSMLDAETADLEPEAKENLVKDLIVEGGVQLPSGADNLIKAGTGEEKDGSLLKQFVKDTQGTGNRVENVMKGLVQSGEYNDEDLKKIHEALTTDEQYELTDAADADKNWSDMSEHINSMLNDAEVTKSNDYLNSIDSTVNTIAGIIAAGKVEEGYLPDAAKQSAQLQRDLIGESGVVDSWAQQLARGKDADGKIITNGTDFNKSLDKLISIQDANNNYIKTLQEGRQAAVEKYGEGSSQVAEFDAEIKSAKDNAALIATYIQNAANSFNETQTGFNNAANSVFNTIAKINSDPNMSSETQKTEITGALQGLVKDLQALNFNPEQIAGIFKENNLGVDLKVENGEFATDVGKQISDQVNSQNYDINAVLNISSITMPGLASGQNNPNSAFHRYGTMARGSRKGYTIPGRPTLTGEEGEELVWEPKRNQAYMVGSNGPQFANISKDAVVWNAEQTKRIKKNSKVGSVGTGAKGIHHFGTMAGGHFGSMVGGTGTTLPGVLNLNATANIQEVIPPAEEPTIPVKADLQVEGNNGGGLLSKIFGGGDKGGPSINVAANVTTVKTGEQVKALDIIGNITKIESSSTTGHVEATATVTKVTKASQIAGEPISVKATATTTQVKNDVKTPKVSAGSQTMNVTANTSAAQAKINKLISLFNKTYTLKYTASGPSSIKVPISANFTGSWRKTVEITKGSGANGINNQRFGSLASGSGHGTVGPNNRGGLTLTGEKGFEIAWLPSENRSMILGANGPQMLNLPKDAVVFTNEQSKKILKQKAIPAGSHSGNSVQGNDIFKYLNVGGGGGYTQTTKHITKTADKVAKATTDAASKVGYVSVWWENIARKTEVSQRKMDSSQKAFEKYIKEMRATLKGTGQSLKSGGGGGDAYLTNIANTIGYYEAQVNKATSELKTLNAGTKAQQKASKTKSKKDDKKANKNAYNSGAASAAKISYKSGKKSEEEIVNLAPYIKMENGAYVVDQKKLNKIKNEDKRKAIADAANKEINDRISKKNSAEDAIEKAKEALEKFGEELYNTFFKWENELTKIWNITQKIEATEARIGRAKGYSELLTSQLSTGMAKAGGKFSKQTLEAFKTGINNQRKQLEQTVSSLGEKRNNLNNLLSLDDEKTTLKSIQNKLVNDIKYDADYKKATEKEESKKKALDKAKQGTKTTTTSKVSKISSTLKKGSKGNDVKTLQQALNKALGTNLAIDGQFGKKTQAAVKQFQKKYGLTVDGVVGKQTLTKLASLTKTKTTYKKNQTAINKAQKEYDDAVAARKAIENRGTNLNKTQKLGYETYAANLEKQINAQAEAWKYLTVQRRGDGTIDLSFDTGAFEKQQQAGNISEELGKSIQDYVKELVDANKELNEEYENTVSLMNDMYGSLETLQDQWVDYANELWDMSEEQTKKEIDNAKKLNDSLTKSLKNLLDDVKKKLDQRRQQEDNAKTEKDISQKQQRLATLRADTSGGHQVEIAQLEKEIAEAQQNYQRTLEDQLLDKLQEQADLAAEQRERQIELQEATVNAINNAAQVNEWMAHPELYYDEMLEAYKTKNDYNEKPEAIQKDLLNKFEVMYDGLLNNQDEQKHVQEQIDILEEQKDYLQIIKDNMAALAENAPTTKVSGGSGVTEGGTKTLEDKTEKQANKTTAKKTTAAKKKTTTSLKYGKVSAVSGNLKKGSKGNGVKALQDALNKTISAGLAVDGDFGKKTQAAVKKFQKKYGLTVDGIVGNQTKKKFKTLGYKTGGLADYTGPAWLDGTPSKPELVLNAKDTKNFLALKDVLSKAMSSTGAVENTYSGDAMYEININVDKIEKDYDVDRVIEKVKKEITKGAGYRNVTQVRNFR